MLSYQHLYHAGNPADVHKHVLLAGMVSRMMEKPKPISYLETHAGRGVYDLTAPEARKTGEAAAGIGALLAKLPVDHPYCRVLADVRADFGPESYPGSPMIAARLLRFEDNMHLAELHPQEHAALQAAIGPGPRLYQRDGFDMAQSICPPDPRRGLVLIDPSYEIKDDYQRLPRFITLLHRKWNVGLIALWYPILTTGAHVPMIRALTSANLPKVIRHEVRFPPARPGHGMIGSGLFIVNAPYGIDGDIALLDRVFGGKKR